MSNVLPTFSFKRRVAVLFSGGDAPGMNPFLRAFVRLGLNRHEAEVWGVRDGYQGLVRAARRLRSGECTVDDIVARIESRRGLAGLRDRSLDVVSLDHETVSGLSGRGGIVLGAARCAEFHDEATRQLVLRWLEAMQIEALVVCGGNGSLTGAERLDAEGNLLVIGVPGSIDNDVPCTERSLGVDTAVNTLIWAIERFHDTAGSHGRVMVLETMGRDSGELARLAALAWGAFTLPMTKRRVLQDKKIEAVHRDESWEHAASRAVAEVIGKSVVGLKPLVGLPSFQQSDRNGAIKECDVQAFRLDLPAGIEPMAGLITEWLTVEEWLDPLRAPISPTAVNLLKQAEGEVKLAGRSFP